MAATSRCVLQDELFLLARIPQLRPRGAKSNGFFAAPEVSQVLRGCGSSGFCISDDPGGQLQCILVKAQGSFFQSYSLPGLRPAKRRLLAPQFRWTEKRSQPSAASGAEVLSGSYLLLSQCPHKLEGAAIGTRESLKMNKREGAKLLNRPVWISVLYLESFP